MSGPKTVLRIALCGAAAAVFAVAGCSGTPTQPTTPPSAASIAGLQLKRTKFMAFGDSITAGEVTVPISQLAPGFPSFRQIQVLSAAYPTVLNSMLVARYPSQAALIFVANAGAGGEKAEFALARFNSAFETYRPDVVLLMEGYNDICCGNNEAGVRKTENGVSELGAEARNRGARVFIANLAPSRDGGSRTIPLNIVQAANERIQVVAMGEGAYLVDVYSALLPEVNANIGIDGLHPTELGYRRIAEAFFAAIQADLEIR